MWHTFLGSSEDDSGWDIVADKNGFLYVAGHSLAAWGSPVESFTAGGRDAFAAKLQSSTGNLIWNTFMGSPANEMGFEISVNNGNNIYITGASKGSWGTPVFPFSGDYEAFVVKLDEDGTAQWHGFLGSASVDEYDWAFSIAINSDGDIFIAGESDSSWGKPVRAHTEKTDVFVTRIDDSFPWPIFYPAFLNRE